MISREKSIAAVAVLAGGKSSRMGRDKAALRIADSGMTLLERTVAVARAVCPTVLVVGRPRPADWPDQDTAFLPDETPELGPAGGLRTALRRADGPVLLLPCDLPNLTPEALTWLVEALAAAGSSAGGAAVNGAQVEPLFAVYPPDCLPALEARLAEGRRSLHGLIETLAGAGSFLLLPAPPAVAAALANVNTPEDWRRFGQVATPETVRKQSDGTVTAFTGRNGRTGEGDEDTVESDESAAADHALGTGGAGPR